MKNNKLVKRTSLLIISAFALAMSCQEEDRITLKDTQDITEEALTDSYFQDTDDMAGVAIGSPTDSEYSGGRTSGEITIQDERFKCNGVVVTLVRDPNSTPEFPKGVITANFGTTGCTDLRGNIRTGKLTFTFSGRRFMPGATVVTTTDNYTINGIKLEGTRTLTNETVSTADAPKFKVVLAGGKATFEDGTTATRESTIISTWIRATNPAEDKLIIDQSSTANGTTRGGRTYEMSLTKQLEYKRFCGIAVSGIKRFLIDNEKEIIINYGEGECDKEITVTVNGVTRNITVKK